MYIVSRKVNWCSYCGKQHGASSKEMKLELPHDAAIPHLGVDPKKIESNFKIYMHPNVHNSMFTIVKIWKAT